MHLSASLGFLTNKLVLKNNKKYRSQYKLEYFTILDEVKERHDLFFLPLRQTWRWILIWFCGCECNQITHFSGPQLPYGVIKGQGSDFLGTYQVNHQDLGWKETLPQLSKSLHIKDALVRVAHGSGDRPWLHGFWDPVSKCRTLCSKWLRMWRHCYKTLR